MIQVPTMEEFEALQKQVADLQRQVRYLMSSELTWLSIAQTMNALQCSRATLHRMQKDGRLVPAQHGSKPMYKVEAIRSYIESTRVSPKEADDRIIKARNPDLQSWC